MNKLAAILFAFSLISVTGCDDARVTGADAQANAALAAPGHTVPPCPPSVCGEPSDWR